MLSSLARLGEVVGVSTGVEEAGGEVGDLGRNTVSCLPSFLLDQHLYAEVVEFVVG